MTLTDRQIERYSRQIIVAGFGARGQERLLACRLRLIGTLDDLTMVIPYLAGAGFGAISIGLAPGRYPELERLADLNSDCAITTEIDSADANAALVLIGGGDALEFARSEVAHVPRRQSIVARLDDPARIAITPAPPPCPRCAGILDAPFSIRHAMSDVVAMAAAVEAIKLAAGAEPIAEPSLITFDNYESHCLPIEAATNLPCPCGLAARP